MACKRCGQEWHERHCDVVRLETILREVRDALVRHCDKDIGPYECNGACSICDVQSSISKIDTALEGSGE